MRRVTHPVAISSFRAAMPVMLAVASLVCVLCLGSPTEAVAGANPDFRIVLHGKSSSFEPCSGYLPVDCLNTMPTVNVPAAPLAVFALLYNVNQASGVQTAFRWSGWSYTFGLFDCLPGVYCNFAPCPSFPHPQSMNIDLEFNCITTPGLHAFGRFFLVPAGNAGCISQYDAGFPFGIHLRDCSGGMDIIDDPNSYRLGKICVGAGGVTGCDAVVPVESATWGKIKATY